MAVHALVPTERESVDGFVTRVNERLMAVLTSSPSWLGDGCPPVLVSLVRTQLLAGLLMTFRIQAVEQEYLFRELMLSLSAQMSGRVATHTADLAAFQERVGLIASDLSQGLKDLETSLTEARGDVQEVRLAATTLLARLATVQAEQLPLTGRFRSLIIEKTREFVGRSHVYREFDAWMAGNRCGYFTIQGDPGIGKSAIIANYTRRTGCLAYFNQRASGVTRPSRFLQNVCGQLLERLGNPASGLPPMADQDGGFLAELLDEVTLRSGDDPLVIAVDALDEVDFTIQDRGTNVLYLPPQLPDGVFFLLSRRNVPLRLVTDVPSHTLDLMHPQFRADNEADARSYVSRCADRPEVVQWIEASELTHDGFVDLLTELSDANFMYLHHVIADVSTGRWSPDSLPAGLQNYYAGHWELMGMNQTPQPSDKLKVLYVLLEYGQPVSLRLLSEITREPAVVVAEVLRQWHAFLHREPFGDQPRYTLYHESFADFLRKEETLAASRIDLAEINDLIAMRLEDGFTGAQD